MGIQLNATGSWADLSGGGVETDQGILTLRRNKKSKICPEAYIKSWKLISIQKK
jgi:hypothetical protein